MSEVINKINVKDVVEFINGIDGDKFKDIVKATGFVGGLFVYVKHLIIFCKKGGYCCDE